MKNLHTLLMRVTLTLAGVLQAVLRMRSAIATLKWLLWEQPGLVCPGWEFLWIPSSSSGCSPRWSPESLRRGRLRGVVGRRGGSS